MQQLPLAIEDALIGWVQAVLSDATPIWANQDGHRPDPPFVQLQVITGPQNLGAAEERYKEEDTFTYAFRKRGTLNLQIFGDDALTRANSVVNAIELPTRQSLLQASGIAVWGAEPVRDITALLDTAHEGRASLDLYISWPEPVDDAPGEIRSVQVTGAVDGQTVDAAIDSQA